MHHEGIPAELKTGIPRHSEDGLNSAHMFSCELALGGALMGQNCGV